MLSSRRRAHTQCTLRPRTHAHSGARPPQRAAIRWARLAASRALRTQLHCTPARCVRKKRTQEARGGRTDRGRLQRDQQSSPDARESTPPPQGAIPLARNNPRRVTNYSKCLCEKYFHELFGHFPRLLNLTSGFPIKKGEFFFYFLSFYFRKHTFLEMRIDWAGTHRTSSTGL